MPTEKESNDSLENLVALAEKEISGDNRNDGIPTDANPISKSRQLKCIDFLSSVHTVEPEKDTSNKKRCVTTSNYSGYSDEENENLSLFAHEKSIESLPCKNDTSCSSPLAKRNQYSSWKPAENKQNDFKQQNDYTDFFGIRVIKPLISSTALKARMADKNAVGISRLQTFVLKITQDKNWVVAGVIVAKGPVKTSQSGKKFMVWTLSDLTSDLATAAIFLFGSAFQDLWKTTEGTVIAVLNPDLMENSKNSKDKATLKISTPDRVLILGTAKDYGTCKHRKVNGEKCLSFVNMSSSEFCIYHIKQAYQNFSKRSSFQTNSKGLTDLRNKVLGKNEVFYAGKSYMAIPAKRNTKQSSKDNTYLQRLSGNNVTVVNTQPKKNFTVANVTTSGDTSVSQRQNDLLKLQKLGWDPEEAKQMDSGALKRAELCSSSYSKQTNSEPPEYIDLNIDFKKGKETLNAAALSLLTGKKLVGRNTEPKVCPTRLDKAKQNAITFVKKNGPLPKINPNIDKNYGTKKRPIELQENENPSKKLKISVQSNENSFASERFKKMMALTSKNLNLLEHHDEEEKEKYFSKLEMKERLEEKMLNTFKVPCKAVKCLKCKYTNFSAADRCKEERHPLRVFDSFKRFFKCGDCGNRTVTLEIIPLFSCKKCSSGKWERTSMMKEKRIEIVGEKLSIRGDEQKFVQSDINNANLNLMVPDE